MRPSHINMLLFSRAFSLFLLSCLLAPGVWAFDRPNHKSLPDLDKRTSSSKEPKNDSKRGSALRKLQSKHSGVQIDFYSRHGSPQWVRRANGPLAENDPANAAALGYSGTCTIGLPRHDFGDQFPAIVSLPRATEIRRRADDYGITTPSQAGQVRTDLKRFIVSEFLPG